MIRIAERPVMPSNPCEKTPGSKRTVVSEPESFVNFASRHEWPKCVNSIPILWRRKAAKGVVEACG